MSKGASVTYTVTGDVADIWYVKESGLGTLNYKIGNGSFTSVNANSTTYNPSARIQNVSLGTSGSHTITISATGNPIYLDGFTIYNGDQSKGIQMYDAAYSGADVETYLQDLAGFTQSVAKVSPQLVSIALGANDYLEQHPPATFKSELEQLVSAIKSLPNPPSIELVAVYQVYNPDTARYHYPSYVQQMQDIAAADPGHINFLDLSKVMPVADTSGTGYYTTDGLHPNNTGQRVVAKFFYNSITN